jgi:type VI secretion system secreted protein Hcp
MAVDMFWKVDGGKIKGESQADGHKDEVDIYSYSWGVSNAATFAHGSGGGSGRSTFGDFNVTKRVDSASHLLALNCADGTHIKEAVLSVRKAGGAKGKGQSDYLIFKFNDILITGVQHSGSSGADEQMESVSFAYSKVEFEYKIQKQDGSVASAGVFKYDLQKRISA